MTAKGRSFTAPAPSGCPVRRGNRTGSVAAVRPRASPAPVRGVDRPSCDRRPGIDRLLNAVEIVLARGLNWLS